MLLDLRHYNSTFRSILKLSSDNYVTSKEGGACCAYFDALVRKLNVYDQTKNHSAQHLSKCKLWEVICPFPNSPFRNFSFQLKIPKQNFRMIYTKFFPVSFIKVF